MLSTQLSSNTELVSYILKSLEIKHTTEILQTELLSHPEYPAQTGMGISLIPKVFASLSRSLGIG